MSEEKVILWHYTIKDYLSRIIETGEIRPATAGITAREKPCVWFSTNQTWEPTANKLIERQDGFICPGTKETTEKYGGGLVRIGVAPETAPHNWHAFKRLSNISAKVAKAMYNAGIDSGAKPSEWFVSFNSVPRPKWLAVETWNGVAWVAVANATISEGDGNER